MRRRFALLATVAMLGAASAEAAPTAGDLIGTWSCRPTDGGTAFAWIVSDDLGGGWLIGEGFENGALQSLDAWAYDDRGRLGDRRQFTATGAYVHLSVASRSPDGLQSNGTAVLVDGATLKVRHRLRRVAPGTLEATWQVLRDDTWQLHADEICTREAVD